MALSNLLETRIAILNESYRQSGKLPEEGVEDFRDFFLQEVAPYLPFYDMKDYCLSFNMSGLPRSLKAKSNHYKLDSPIRTKYPVLLAGGIIYDLLGDLLQNLELVERNGKYYLVTPLKYIL